MLEYTKSHCTIARTLNGSTVDYVNSISKKQLPHTQIHRGVRQMSEALSSHVLLTEKGCGGGLKVQFRRSTDIASEHLYSQTDNLQLKEISLCDKRKHMGVSRQSFLTPSSKSRG